MEPFFTNEYQETREIYLEVAAKVSRCYGKKKRIIFCFCTGVFASGASYLFYLNKVLFALPLSICACICVYYGFFAYKTFAEEHFKTTDFTFGTAYFTYSFYNEYIKFEVHNSTDKITYDKIFDMLETKNTYALMIGRRARINYGLFLKKDSFRGIDEAGFLSYIKEKCPSLKQK